jgi:hypothetical protein
MIYVPSPCEGLSFGKFENKAGMQGDRNCAIFLENVGVPKGFRAAGPGDGVHEDRNGPVLGGVGHQAMELDVGPYQVHQVFLEAFQAFAQKGNLLAGGPLGGQRGGHRLQ